MDYCPERDDDMPHCFCSKGIENQPICCYCGVSKPSIVDSLEDDGRFEE